MKTLIAALMMVFMATAASAQTPVAAKASYHGYGQVFQYRVINELGWALPYQSQFLTMASLYRVDAAGNREFSSIAYSNCWGDEPWYDGCVQDGGWGQFSRDSSGNPLQNGQYEISVKANYHVVARVRFSLPAYDVVDVKPELVPAFAYDLGDNVTPTVPSEGGMLTKRIGLWNFKDKNGLVGVQVMLSGPSRTTDSTYYTLPFVNLPLPEAGSGSEHTIEVPIEGDLPNGWYCATIRVARRDHAADEYNTTFFCGLKGSPVIADSPTVKK